MLTKDNTKGFTQKELDEMNAEAKQIMYYQNPCDITADGLQWAEEEVLKIHKGV